MLLAGLLAELLHALGDLSAPEISCFVHGTIWWVQWGQVSEVLHGKVVVVVQPGQVLEVMHWTNGLLAGLLHVPGDLFAPGTWCVAIGFHGTGGQVQWGEGSEAVRGKTMAAVQLGQVSEAMRGTKGLLAGRLHVPGNLSGPGT